MHLTGLKLHGDEMLLDYDLTAKSESGLMLTHKLIYSYYLIRNDCVLTKLTPANPSILTTLVD
jgi:hypothetical protein